MSEPTCPGCIERDALLAALRAQLDALQQRVADLEAQLGRNASNSSTPPSANPPAAPKPVAKKPSGRRPGGQPGHQGHTRQRLPQERVNHVIALIPSHCANCQAPLPAQAGAADPPPSWHQVAELPRGAAVVTEFQGHTRTCSCCGHQSREDIPAAIRARAFGPRLTATLAYLAGSQHVSRRGLEEICETLFDIPVSLGTIAALERQTAAALEQPHQQIGAAVKNAAVKNVDETSWKLKGRLCWLWVAVTHGVCYFLIRSSRSAASLRDLLGGVIKGTIGSDRYSAYHRVPLAQRQVCWAHLLRDFQAMVDRKNKGSYIGTLLLELAEKLFAHWQRVRDGTWSRRRFRRWSEAEGGVRQQIEGLLLRGFDCPCARTQTVCAALLDHWPALWTFARQEGVEPTNNAAERALRPAVIWRKISYGSQSEEGLRFVERLASVVGTLRQQGRQVLGYLVEAVRAFQHGSPPPAIVPTD
jgi:transposase